MPISLVYRKDLVKKDGSDAFLLDAYVRPWLNIKAQLLLCCPSAQGSDDTACAAAHRIVALLFGVAGRLRSLERRVLQQQPPGAAGSRLRVRRRTRARWRRLGAALVRASLPAEMAPDRVHQTQRDRRLTRVIFPPRYERGKYLHVRHPFLPPCLAVG